MTSTSYDLDSIIEVVLDDGFIDKVINSKQLSDIERQDDLMLLRNSDIILAGNKFQNHHMIYELINTKTTQGSLIDIVNDATKLGNLIELTARMGRHGSIENRLFEAWRMVYNGPTLFKASIAKTLYNDIKPQLVFDPCAGWGGRMLGAWALDIDYIGMDTNTNLVQGYESMFVDLGKRYHIVYGDSLTTEWPDCDLVFTCPPYGNTEIYSDMAVFENYHQEFLEPLIQRCHAARTTFALCLTLDLGDWVEALYRQADFGFDIQKTNRWDRKKVEHIYVWEC